MILYFSGTGNSRFAAEKIAEITGDELVCLNNYIKDGIAGDFVSGKPFVLVCPTYAWRVPLELERFMENARLEGSDEMYFVLTCGSSTAGAQSYARKLCTKIGKIFKGFRTVVMPENYIAMFPVPDPDEAADIVKRAIPVIEDAAETIARGDELSEKVPAFGRIMSTLVNWVFFTFMVKDKGFHLEKECTSCGQCAKLCPLNNITLEGGKPVWGGNCTHCMSCICGCPAECIEYKNASRKRRRYWFGR